jgi:hypothetical protein
MSRLDVGKWRIRSALLLETRMRNQLKIIAAGLGLAVGGLGLFSVSASAMPASGVASISKVNHLPDAAGLPIEHVQFPCIFPFPCGYGYYGPSYYGGGYYGGGYYRGGHRGRGYYGRGHGGGYYGRGHGGGGHGGGGHGGGGHRGGHR